MNSKTIDELRKTLPKRTQVSYDSWTKEQKQLDRELSCRKMIMSCLIYDEDFISSDYKNDYIKDLGEQRINELYQEQLEYFKKCEVLKNVYEDSEGLSYNSLIEK